MNVPFLDLRAQYAAIRPEIEQGIAQVMAEAAFAGGPFVEKFEHAFAEYCQSDHAIGVANGTEALWLALLALGIGAGDEVITVPNTFIATVEAIHFCGAKPVFVDVDGKTCNMDPSHLERALTSRTAAIMPVHLYGQTADMDPIMAFAKKHRLFVIEDACQAHGALYKGRKAGSIGDIGCFSFYPGKNLGAYGDAGAVVTSDRQFADRIKMLRDHGQNKKYHHALIGWNARMDGIQAAVLSTKLKYLPEWNEKRRMHAAHYSDLLKDVAGVTTPSEAAYGTHVYHVYAVHCTQREALREYLTERGIGHGIHYPVPLHKQPAPGLQNGEDSFPVAERCAGQTLSLPMFPEMRPEQIAYVAEHIRGYTQS